jgi:hypothetical protein
MAGGGGRAGHDEHRLARGGDELHASFTARPASTSEVSGVWMEDDLSSPGPRPPGECSTHSCSIAEITEAKSSYLLVGR